MRNKIVLIVIMLGLCLSVMAQEQKSETCSVKGLKGGKYNLISEIFPSRTPKKVILDIWVKPNNFTKEYMTKLANRLKAKYCNEDEISVSIFDSRKAQVNWHYDVIISHGKNDRRRGYYSLDRKTGEEVIAFSTKPGNQVGEVKIILSESKKKVQKYP